MADSAVVVQGPLADGRPNFRLNLEESVSTIFRDPAWLAKLALGAVFSLLSVVVIGGIFTEGYLIAYSTRVARAEAQPLPEWDDFGELFRKGLVGWLAGLIYSLPLLLVLSLYLLFSVISPFFLLGLTTNGSSAFLGLTLISLLLLLLLVPIALLVGIVRPAAHAQLVLTNCDFKAAFDFRAIWAFMRRYRGQYALMLLLILAAGSALNQIGYFALCIGIFVTQFLVQLAQAHLIGQFCWCERAIARAEGGGTAA